MSILDLSDIAYRLTAQDKGILAMDESIPTLHRRFAPLNIPLTVEARRSYRELLVTAPRIEEYLNGAILYEETMRQSTSHGVPFLEVLQERGIIPGIKVDAGLADLPFTAGEKITSGHDGLPERVAEYRALGARFAKWRAAFTIGDGMPSERAIRANAQALARYAAVCLEGGLVPIVEPEVLMNGDHTLEACYRATSRVLDGVFDALASEGVRLGEIILKPNMVTSGAANEYKAGQSDVAYATVTCMHEHVPHAVSGVAFLSGGQSPELATAHLDAINRHAGQHAPWPLTFSFSRAIQQPALAAWRGEPKNVAAAQGALIFRLQLIRAAVRNRHTYPMEL